jgi:hypothetical protein
VKGGNDMTLSTINQGDVLTVRSYKQYAGFAWANNYEVEATQDITNPVSALQFLVERIAFLERDIHLNSVVIDRITVSTYVPDSRPYNPNTLATYPLSINGTRPVSANVLPLELCLFVRRNVDFGRDGRLLYRGCLTENDMFAESFRPLITANAVNSIQSIINGWRTVGVGSDFRLVMASGFPNVSNVRPVVGLQVSEKMVVKKYNNRYFRRNP